MSSDLKLAHKNYLCLHVQYDFERGWKQVSRKRRRVAEGGFPWPNCTILFRDAEAGSFNLRDPMLGIECDVVI